MGKSRVFGTAAYAAPELPTSAHDKEVDVFSFGVILFEIESQEHCWPSSKSVFDVRELIAKGSSPGDLNLCPTMGGLIKQCTQIVPSLRPTFEEIVEALNGGQKL